MAEGRKLKLPLVREEEEEDVYNSRHLQGALSHTCGHYCVYVAKRLARGYTLRRILRDFSLLNNYYNDRLVVSRL